MALLLYLFLTTSVATGYLDSKLFFAMLQISAQDLRITAMDRMISKHPNCHKTKDEVSNYLCRSLKQTEPRANTEWGQAPLLPRQQFAHMQWF